MTRKQSKTAAAQAVAAIDPQVLAALVPGPLSREQADELFGRLKKAVYERALGAELTHHLGYAAGQPRRKRPPNPY
jgi:putative transposase